ncbi:MAG: hypothetical protein AABX11_06945 [Nanoarchaeota archaeon]
MERKGQLTQGKLIALFIGILVFVTVAFFLYNSGWLDKIRGLPSYGTGNQSDRFVGVDADGKAVEIVAPIVGTGISGPGTECPILKGKLELIKTRGMELYEVQFTSSGNTGYYSSKIYISNKLFSETNSNIYGLYTSSDTNDYSYYGDVVVTSEKTRGYFAFNDCWKNGGCKTVDDDSNLPYSSYFEYLKGTYLLINPKTKYVYLCNESKVEVGYSSSMDLLLDLKKDIEMAVPPESKNYSVNYLGGYTFYSWSDGKGPGTCSLWYNNYNQKSTCLCLCKTTSNPLKDCGAGECVPVISENVPYVLLSHYLDVNTIISHNTKLELFCNTFDSKKRCILMEKKL